MSPEGLITSEFDDAAIIDSDVDDLAVAGVAADPADLAELEVVVLALTATVVVVDVAVEGTVGADVRAVPGAEALIRRLRAVGVAVALTSGFSRATTDAVLAAVGWRDLSDVTLTPEEAGRGAPYPDLPLTALLRSGATTVEGLVVVGDTAADIAGGLAAGAGLAVGVLTGRNDEPALLSAGADAVIASVADLGELLGLDDLGLDDLGLDDLGLDDLERVDALGDVETGRTGRP